MLWAAGPPGSSNSRALRAPARSAPAGAPQHAAPLPRAAASATASLPPRARPHPPRVRQHPTRAAGSAPCTSPDAAGRAGARGRAFAARGRSALVAFELPRVELRLRVAKVEATSRSSRRALVELRRTPTEARAARSSSASATRDSSMQGCCAPPPRLLPERRSRGAGDPVGSPAPRLRLQSPAARGCRCSRATNGARAGATGAEMFAALPAARRAPLRPRLTARARAPRCARAARPAPALQRRCWLQLAPRLRRSGTPHGGCAQVPGMTRAGGASRSASRSPAAA